LANPVLQRQINENTELSMQQLFWHIEEEAYVHGLDLSNINYEIFQKWIAKYHELRPKKPQELRGLRLAPLSASKIV
jgi:hypothetical protein